MKQNEAAIHALREYARIENPRYAFMIEAPWGSGKTHLIKREFESLLHNEKARYVTLNGVADRKSFRKAMISGTPQAKLAETLGKAGNSLGLFAKFGNVGSILQDIIEDRMIDNLPNLIIFDDRERCEISPNELLGIINEFVEHKPKNVVICGFIENDLAQDKADHLRKIKEKVVGRTVRIVADVATALPEFVHAMPDGPGKKWMHDNIETITEIFNADGGGNLRVLRQCVHDCGRVLDILNETILKSHTAISRFVQTYLALALMHVAGKISAKQLNDREKHSCCSKPADGQEEHPLYICSNKHPHAEIWSGHSSSILPTELGLSLISIGYEDPSEVNRILLNTGQFQGITEIPIWRKLVEWRRTPTEDLKEIMNDALNYALKEDMIEPGPYLHIANDLISIAKDSDQDSVAMFSMIKERIVDLANRGKIPAAKYGINYGWSWERGFSYGGYTFDSYKEMDELQNEMKKAQLAAFNTGLHSEAIRLKKLLSNDIDLLSKEFSHSSDGGSYHYTEILHLIEPQFFAGVVLEHATSGQYDLVGRLVEDLARRHRGTKNFDQEAAWADSVKTCLTDLANKNGPLEAAQMKWFLNYFWKFKSPSRSAPNL